MLTAIKVYGLIALFSLFLGSAMPGQIPPAAAQARDGWGPWRYTNSIVAGVVYRSKCAGFADGDSTWEYQFRNRHDDENEFVEREERGAQGTGKNEWSVPMIVVLEQGQLSPTYKSRLHGTCVEMHELKIEVLCDTDPVYAVNASCFHDATGAELEHKRAPASASHR